jgi:glucose-1-phosphate thymidylyltransferase
MKGILLAGGNGTRLSPMTSVISKHLLPVYDKPLIFYSLSVLMLAGIRDIYIVCKACDLNQYKELLGDGNSLGLSINYKTQENPGGIAEAFLICEKEINGHRVCLVLGDNIFFGEGFTETLQEAMKFESGASAFGCRVNNPSQFGIVELDEQQLPKTIEEKPKYPKSDYAVPGLYFFDQSVVERAKSINRSKRGELEITDINKQYLDEGTLKITVLGRSFVWIDAGTPDRLLEASYFVKTLQQRNSLQVACLEEIAFRQNWIQEKDIENAIIRTKGSQYSDYLKKLVNYDC